MPIYEFFSPSTGKIYSFFARSTQYSNEIPICPDGKSKKMKKILSGFSITGNHSEETESAEQGADEENPFDNLDPKKAELAMRELERSMDGMDEENPDPKQMGSLMRRMCEITGEKMDGQIEEVVRKLEEGVDPNSLEEEMGDFSENDDHALQDGEGITPKEFRNKVEKMLQKKLIRDPMLYEFSDYLA